MYYVYVLLSQTDNEKYIGSTNDLRDRLKKHNDGEIVSTKRYRPWQLVYYEAYLLEKLARQREKSLKKHGNAKRELYKRLGIIRQQKGI